MDITKLKLKRKKIEVQGVELFIRELSAAEWDEYHEKQAEKKSEHTAAAWVASLVTTDRDGNQVFDFETAQKEISPEVLTDIGLAVVELCGVSEEQIEEVAENFKKGQDNS